MRCSLEVAPSPSNFRLLEPVFAKRCPAFSCVQLEASLKNPGKKHMKRFNMQVIGRIWGCLLSLPTWEILSLDIINLSLAQQAQPVLTKKSRILEKNDPQARCIFCPPKNSAANSVSCLPRFVHFASLLAEAQEIPQENSATTKST